MNGSISDVHGIRVGHWTDEAGATGCTVVLCPRGTVGGYDPRGAAPGSRETDLLRPGNLVEHVDAVLLTGGSAFGLAAATGVVQWLEERGRGFPTPEGPVPIVPGAVIYDLAIGSAQARPDAAAGYAAVDAASDKPGWGTTGAGTGATVAKAAGMGSAVKSGVGTASQRAGRTTVGALVVLNAFGDVVEPATREVLAAPAGGDSSDSLLRRSVAMPAPGTNTTLVVVATNARVDRAGVQRMATVAHNGIARCVRPSHTPYDGDIAFGLATGELEAGGPLSLAVLCSLAETATEMALLHALASATPLAGVPTYQSLRGASGPRPRETP